MTAYDDPPELHDMRREMRQRATDLRASVIGRDPSDPDVREIEATADDIERWADALRAVVR